MAKYLNDVVTHVEPLVAAVGCFLKPQMHKENKTWQIVTFGVRRHPYIYDESRSIPQATIKQPNPRSIWTRTHNTLEANIVHVVHLLVHTLRYHLLWLWRVNSVAALPPSKGAWAQVFPKVAFSTVSWHQRFFDTSHFGNYQKRPF